MFVQLYINASELVAKHKETELVQMANEIRFQTIITPEASTGTHMDSVKVKHSNIYITIY
jgi:hypothetical protein